VFPIYDVSDSPADRPEALGSKEKVWLMPEPRHGLPASPHLFKAGRPNTGENWAEKACCEILKVLKIPAAQYHLAVRNGVQGVLAESFLPPRSSFVPANMFLSSIDPAYNGTLRFYQTRYTVSAALESLKLVALKGPLHISDIYRDMSSQDIFVGYLLFDALVGNTDRHHENWGVVIVEVEDPTMVGKWNLTFHLAPSFDHASSLGRDLPDHKRRKRLTTGDKRANVEAYAERGRSAFFGADPVDRTLTGRQIVKSLVRLVPEPTRTWAGGLVNLAPIHLETIFQKMPREFISEDAVRFAMRLLAHNQGMIQEVALAL
jgi:hypothetical protein